MKLYEITEDLRAISELFESAVDENGDPRELNDQEKEYLSECFLNSQEDFENKFDSYGKLMANLKAQSEVAEGERKAMKGEMDRLSARSKVFANRRESVKEYLFFNMKNLNLDKFKTALFSAGVQQSPISIVQTGIIKNIPEEFLKPREINSSAIKSAIKDGKIVNVDGDLFYNGEELSGIRAERSEILVVR